MPSSTGEGLRGMGRVRSIAIPAVSLVILTCLGLQILVISRISWAPSSFSRLYDVHWVRPSASWPFVDYPMYSEAHHEGERLSTHQVVATADDGREVILRPEDRTIVPRTSALLIPLILQDRKRVDRYCEAYRRRNGRTLIAFRLDEHPLELTRKGLVPLPQEGTDVR
jgi:hypothetical protein